MFTSKFKSFFIVFLLFMLFPLKSLASEKYIVQKGDTLWNISVVKNISLQKIINVNEHLINPNLIFPGDIIYLPLDAEDGLSFQEQLLALINSERTRNGLTPLSEDASLSILAQKKVMDMMQLKYVAHNSPTYGNPTLMLKAFHIPFTKVYENLSAGQRDANDVFRIWMQSPIHRDNILRKDVSHCGIGFVEGGLHHYYWAQLIIKR